MKIKVRSQRSIKYILKYFFSQNSQSQYVVRRTYSWNPNKRTGTLINFQEIFYPARFEFLRFLTKTLRKNDLELH